jgi:hypothetical protein
MHLVPTSYFLLDDCDIYFGDDFRRYSFFFRNGGFPGLFVPGFNGGFLPRY